MALTWSEAALQYGVRGEAVAFGGGKYCLVGQDVISYTSTDGINWNTHDNGTLPFAAWAGICYIGGVFYASDRGGSKYARSADGITWTSGQADFRAYKFAVGAGIAMCSAQGVSSKRSTDGINWTASNIPGGYAKRECFLWNGSQFVAISKYGYWCTSADGISWTEVGITTGASSSPGDMAYNGSVYCMVGSLCPSATSPDGLTWTTHTMPTDGVWSRIVWDGSQFIAFKELSTEYATSADGITWTAQAFPHNTVDEIGVVVAPDGEVVVASGAYVQTGTPPAGATGTINVPIALVIGSVYSVPITMTVQGFGALSVPVALNVGSLGTTTTPLSLSVTPAGFADGSQSAADSIAGLAGQWAAKVTLDGVDISANCIGEITIEAEENSARIAEFTLRPNAGETIALPAMAGKSVAIDLCALVGGVAMYPVRLFTGVVDRPDYDIKARVIKFTCTDGRDALCNALSNAEIEALVGGHWSPAIFDAAATGLNYAKDRLSTVPSALDLSAYREVRVSALETGTADWTFDDDKVLEGSVNVSPVDLSSLINHVDITFDYRFPRMKAEAHPITFQYVTTGSFAQFMIDGKWFLTREAVSAAISSAGGSPLVPINFTPLPDYAIEINYGSTIGYWTPNPDVDATLCMGFSCDVTFDYSNLQQESHRIAVQCPAGVLASGKRASSISGAIEGKAEDTSASEIHAWLYKSDLKTDIPPEVATPLAGFTTDKTITLTADSNRAAADAAMETLIATAKTQIIASHRGNTVSFSTVLYPLLDVVDTVELNADGVHAVGKIKRITNRMDADSGEAVSDIELAVSSLSGVGTVHPETTTAAPAGTTDGARALTSNPTIVFNAGATEDHAITITFPQVSNAERDNAVTVIESTFDAPVIENLFTVTT